MASLMTWRSSWRLIDGSLLQTPSRAERETDALMAFEVMTYRRRVDGKGNIGENECPGASGKVIRQICARLHWQSQKSIRHQKWGED